MKGVIYKGYAAAIAFDAEDGVFSGRLVGIKDVVGFHGESVAGLRDAFHEAVDDYIETCAKVGKAPQKPYSGQIMVGEYGDGKPIPNLASVGQTKP